MKRIVQNETSVIIAVAAVASVCLMLIDMLLDHMKHI